MRLAERTMIEIRIAPRKCETGMLGGVQEAFSGETISLRASCLPGEAELAAGSRGAVYPERLRVLTAADAPVRPGDGLWAEGRLYRILSVRRWTAHLEMECEAVSA